VEGIVTALIVGGLAFLGTVYSSAKCQKIQDIKQDARMEAIQAETKSALDAVMYRIKQLEKKQDRHNSLVERMIKVEQVIKDME